ncbi:PPE family protein [Mycobacterium kubicae]|uniref:PPE family protein n=2 Tax=Mycobacterium kubicae TaxID=120959 RepID=A0AAX1JGV5_9MYCO|nr:PPE family protein [Mycobacterium kubicae]MCV7097040.1 PPE family protein [Mycobacterium kubicae]ORV98737.1 hypothetical protein AWC13_13070 [Mycobacterium kubicae]QNI11455.1 PPE family protein [Mycobacterium kubicae]QPI39674.1 PPE family protein [Mycobacterium kubicae]
MDFGALPPEINSACMYAGAGAAPLLAAAAAWHGIAAELSTAAASFESVVTRLTTEQWMGPASLSMVAAAQAHVSWLAYAAECATLAAAQATASVAAFETAFTATVPPAQVAANRARLAHLTATNVFGQNGSAIAATEARYGEMWAQDASAMYGYAASSAAAGRLSPLTNPSDATDPAGIASQAATVGRAAASGSAEQVALGSVVSTGPDAVMSLASPAAAEAGGVADIIGLLSRIDSLDHPFFETANHIRATYWDFGVGFLQMAVPADDAAADSAGSPAAAAEVTRAVTPTTVAATPLQATSGTAASVGRLSVPPGWSTAAPAMIADAPVEGTGWTVPVEDEPTAGAPAPGMVAPDDDVASAAGPRYGVKPIVMPTRGLF